ncbi:MAG TPA: hypothetical protein VFL36_08865 [Myxococcales bacterium]|nr:hypothetical protein [Myxococcales bacterium]
MIALALLLAIDVAVTVDDLPINGPEIQGVTRMGLAEKMLDVFRAHGLPPGYGFVNGSKPDPGVLALWRAAGNPLGRSGTFPAAPGGHRCGNAGLAAEQLRAGGCPLDHAQALPVEN